MLRPGTRTDSAAGPAWVQVLLSAPADKIQRIEFRFTPLYLETLWGRGSAKRRTAHRGLVSPDTETMMLNAPLILDSGTVFAQAWLIPVASETYHIRVQILPYTGTRNLRVTLHWDSGDYAVTLRAGQMLFEDISLPVISRDLNNVPTHRFSMTYEFETSTKNGKH